MSLPFDVLGIGLNATDTLLLVEEFPAYGGKVPFTGEQLSAGGQVATALVACATLGLRSKYIGTVGDDLCARMQRESLEGTGVDTSGVLVRKNCPNQSAYIIIDRRTGERTVLWRRAECLRLSPSEIQPADITKARLLHIDGCDTEAAAYAASIAREHGIPVSLDVDTVYPGFESVLKVVDYLVASSSWPGEWTGERDPFRALASLQRAYNLRIAAITLGENGALALCEGDWTYSPGFQVSCEDTTGAGDVFHGAFCYATLANMSIGAALEFSNAAAALNCTALGARGHMATVSEIETLVAAGAAGTAGRHRAPEMEHSRLQTSKDIRR